MRVMPAAAVAMLAAVAAMAAPRSPAFVRVDLAGYHPDGHKTAVLFADRPLTGSFTVTCDGAARPSLKARVPAKSIGTWGRFPYRYALDFTAVREPGTYVLAAAGAAARVTVTGPGTSNPWPGYFLEFLRQQRLIRSLLALGASNRELARTISASSSSTN